MRLSVVMTIALASWSCDSLTDTWGPDTLTDTWGPDRKTHNTVSSPRAELTGALAEVEKIARREHTMLPIIGSMSVEVRDVVSDIDADSWELPYDLMQNDGTVTIDFEVHSQANYKITIRDGEEILDTLEADGNRTTFLGGGSCGIYPDLTAREASKYGSRFLSHQIVAAHLFPVTDGLLLSPGHVAGFAADSEGRGNLRRGRKESPPDIDDADPEQAVLETVIRLRNINTWKYSMIHVNDEPMIIKHDRDTLGQTFESFVYDSGKTVEFGDHHWFETLDYTSNISPDFRSTILELRPYSY